MSTRMPLMSSEGIVSCDVTVASAAGIEILKAGGNAADAAIAMAAALNVVEPMATGIGGDCFCLFYRASDRTIVGINGSGKSPASLTLELVRDQFTDKVPDTHGFSITVPGAVRGWTDTLEQFGSHTVPLSRILSPAIRLAEEGFSVTKVVARLWQLNEAKLKRARFGSELLLNERAPQEGDLVRNPHLAKVFREIALSGREGFYKGRIAQKIVEETVHAGGCLSMDDMEDVLSYNDTVVKPISTTYKGVRLWEVPPNSQGLLALLALNILQHQEIEDMAHNSPEYIRALAESFELALREGFENIGTEMSEEKLKSMISPDYAKQVLETSREEKNSQSLNISKDTTYLTVVDGEGNACSFINSITQSFGSSHVPENCGFALHNRGVLFNLDKNTPNSFGPRKRPYHTIIPAMITENSSGRLLASFGVMGGFMQFQGHVQVLLNMAKFEMDPQEALYQPRVFVDPDTDFRTRKGFKPIVYLEEGMDERVLPLVAKLIPNSDTKKGTNRLVFGRGHVIAQRCLWDSSASWGREWWAGTDPRCDGEPLKLELSK